MRLLADVHISPRTVEFLRSQGHDVVRVGDSLSATATDQAIVQAALSDDRVILTQDLDFSDIIALSGQTRPSLITLRLSSSRIEHVNATLNKVLPDVAGDVAAGAVVTVRDGRTRRRMLPIH